MQEPFDMNLEIWLAAEQADRDTEAERALARAFSALPAISPSTGFADRVVSAAMPAWTLASSLSRAGVASPASPWRGADVASRGADITPWGRAAAAACLLLAGLAAAYLLPLVLSLARVIAPAEAIGALVQGFVSAFSRIDELLSLWHIWAWMVDTALLVLTAPPVVLALLTLIVLSALTFRGLQRAFVPQASPRPA